MKLTLENLKNTPLTKNYRDLIIKLNYCDKSQRIYCCILTTDNKKYSSGFSLNLENAIEFTVKRFGEENWQPTEERVKLTSYIDLPYWKDEKYRVNKYQYKHPSDNNISTEEFIKGRVL